MESSVVAAIAFACMLTGAMGAMTIAQYLPAHHVSKETQDAVKLGVGMIAAMASLILGLMTASVKGNFDTTDRDVHTYATYVLGLDASLRHYGPDAAPARELLSDYARAVVNETWQGTPDLPALRNTQSSEALLGALDTAVRQLAPVTPEAQELRTEALARLNAITTTRWSVLEESTAAIPTIFTVVLVVWLTLIFASFGLFAPPNVISIVALSLCSASIGGALFLILEMSGPFDGFIAISPKPMQDALISIERFTTGAPPAQPAVR